MSGYISNPTPENHTLVIVNDTNLSQLIDYMIENNISFETQNDGNGYKFTELAQETEVFYNSSAEWDDSGCSYD